MSYISFQGILFLLIIVTLVAHVTFGQSLPSGADALIVDRHNQLRAKLGIKSRVSWSAMVALFAKGRAFAQRCKGLSHVGLRGYGENLAMGSGDISISTIDRLLTMWINEGVGGGHHDQMAWAGSTEVGCAVSTCNNNLYLACNYNPPGNVAGLTIYSGNPLSAAVNVLSKAIPPPPKSEPGLPAPVESKAISIVKSEAQTVKGYSHAGATPVPADLVPMYTEISVSTTPVGVDAYQTPYPGVDTIATIGYNYPTFVNKGEPVDASNQGESSSVSLASNSATARYLPGYTTGVAIVTAAAAALMA